MSDLTEPYKKNLADRDDYYFGQQSIERAAIEQAMFGAEPGITITDPKTGKTRSVGPSASQVEQEREFARQKKLQDSIANAPKGPIPDALNVQHDNPFTAFTKLADVLASPGRQGVLWTLGKDAAPGEEGIVTTQEFLKRLGIPSIEGMDVSTMGGLAKAAGAAALGIGAAAITDPTSFIPLGGPTRSIKAATEVGKKVVSSEAIVNTAKEMAEHAVKFDGGTFSLDGKNLAGDNGWLVSIYDETKRTLDAPTPSAIAQFMDENRELLNLRSHYAGIWKNDAGKYELEVSVRTPSENEAVQLGRTFGQKGVYNPGLQKFVPTHGDGEPSKTLPDLATKFPITERKNLLDEFRFAETQSLTNIISNEARAITDSLTAEVSALKATDIEAGRAGVSAKGFDKLGIVGAATLHRLNTTLNTPYGTWVTELRKRLPEVVNAELTDVDLARLYKKSDSVYRDLVNTAISGMKSPKRLEELVQTGSFHKAAYADFRRDADLIFGNAPITLPSGKQSTNADMFLKFYAAAPSASGKAPTRTETALSSYHAWKSGQPITPTNAAHARELARITQGLPFSPVAFKAHSLYRNLTGDRHAVGLEDAVGAVFGVNPTESGRIAQRRYQFAQEVMRQEAARLGVDPGDYQVALQVAAHSSSRIEKSLSESLNRAVSSKPENYQDLLSIRDVTRRVMGLDEKGSTTMMGTIFLARVLAGASIGAYAGDEENRVLSALAGAGIAASPEVIKSIGKLITKHKTLDVAKRDTLASQPMSAMPKMSAWTPSELQAALKQTAVELSDKEAMLEATRPLTQVEREAELLTNYQVVTPKTITDLYPGATLNDAEMRATQIVLKSSADHLIAMARSVDTADKNSVAEVMRQLVIHGQADLGRRIAETEAGRALNVIDMSVDRNYLAQLSSTVDKLMSGTSPERIIHLLRQTQTPEHATIFAHSATKPEFSKMLTEVWVNGLLSGLRTMVINPLSTGLFQVWNVGERGASVLFGNGTGPREAMAMLRGFYEATQDAFTLAAHTLRTESPHRLDAYGKVEMADPAITAENVANLSGVKLASDVLHPIVTRLEQYGPFSSALDFLSQAATDTINTAGRVIRLPGRVLLSQDDFFKSIAFRAELHAQAVREATAEVEVAGLTGNAARTLYADVYARVLKTPDSSITKKAKDFSFYSTFTQELGPIGQTLQELARQSLAAKVAMPFLLAPTNLLKTGFLERSPLGLGSETFLKDIRAGGETAQLAMTRMGLSTSFLSIASVWAANGWLVGAGPDDPAQLKQMRQRGFVPYSVNVSKVQRDIAGTPSPSAPQPGDTFIEFSKLDPVIAPALGMAANYTSIRGKLSDEDALELAATQGIALSKFIASKSWLTGAAGVTSMFADPEHGFESFIKRQVGTWMPYSSLMGAVARQIDPVVRDPDTITQAWVNKLPFGTLSLIPDRNRYGEEVTYPPGIGPDIASPFFTNTYKADPVLDASIEDEIVLHPPKRYIQKTYLTDAEYDELRVIFGNEAINNEGRTLKEAELDVLQRARDEQHTIGPASWRAAELHKVDIEFKRRAQNILMRRHPDLARSVLDDEDARLSKHDKAVFSTLETDISIADTDGIDVREGKAKSFIPFKVR